MKRIANPNFLIIVYILLTILGLRWICYNIIIIPKWIPYKVSDIEHITIGSARYGGGYKEFTINQVEQIESIYALVNKTRIKMKNFNTGHRNAEVVDAVFCIEFVPYEGQTLRYFVNGARNKGNLVKDQSDSDIFWTYGQKNTQLTEYIRDFFQAEAYKSMLFTDKDNTK